MPSHRSPPADAMLCTCVWVPRALCPGWPATWPLATLGLDLLLASARPAPGPTQCRAPAAETRSLQGACGSTGAGGATPDLSSPPAPGGKPCGLGLTAGHTGWQLLPVQLLHAQGGRVHAPVAGDPGRAQAAVHLGHDDLLRVAHGRGPGDAGQGRRRGRAPQAREGRWGRYGPSRVRQWGRRGRRGRGECSPHARQGRGRRRRRRGRWGRGRWRWRGRGARERGRRWGRGSLQQLWGCWLRCRPALALVAGDERAAEGRGWLLATQVCCWGARVLRGAAPLALAKVGLGALVGLVQGAGAGPPLDGQEAFNHLLQGALLAWGGDVRAQDGVRGQGWPPPPAGREPRLPTRLGSGRGTQAGAAGLVPLPQPRRLTVRGQEHRPVHQALQGLPEQLAGAEVGLQVQEALQHREQVGRRGGAAHLGAGEGCGSVGVTAQASPAGLPARVPTPQVVVV